MSLYIIIINVAVAKNTTNCKGKPSKSIMLMVLTSIDGNDLIDALFHSIIIIAITIRRRGAMKCVLSKNTVEY